MYYVKSSGDKKSEEICDNSPYVHDISSKDQKSAIDIIRWVFAVAGHRADSPRFAYYVSRWRVPEKIAAAKKAGTFKATIAKCPPIDPSWVRFVPDALAEYQAFITPKARPPVSKAAYSGKPYKQRNKPLLAA